MWSTPVADLQLGLLYVTTGQPSPDENGSQRAGDNLYSDSIVALNLTTGLRVWHFQEIHHDIWGLRFRAARSSVHNEQEQPADSGDWPRQQSRLLLSARPA